MRKKFFFGWLFAIILLFMTSYATSSYTTDFFTGADQSDPSWTECSTELQVLNFNCTITDYLLDHFDYCYLIEAELPEGRMWANEQAIPSSNPDFAHCYDYVFFTGESDNIRLYTGYFDMENGQAYPVGQNGILSSRA